jgi:hypothetical protein
LVESEIDLDVAPVKFGAGLLELLFRTGELVGQSRNRLRGDQADDKSAREPEPSPRFFNARSWLVTWLIKIRLRTAASFISRLSSPSPALVRTLTSALRISTAPSGGEIEGFGGRACGVGRRAGSGLGERALELGAKRVR